MPRFIGFVRMEEGVRTPRPQSPFDAIDVHIVERIPNGVFLDGGGLHGVGEAVDFVVRQGEISRVDGPYAEAEEVVGGGWSVPEYDSMEDAVADQREFAEIRAKHCPEVTVISTPRQVVHWRRPPATEGVSLRWPRVGRPLCRGLGRGHRHRLAGRVGPPRRRAHTNDA